MYGIGLPSIVLGKSRREMNHDKDLHQTFMMKWKRINGKVIKNLQRLEKIGIISKWGVWAPYTLGEKNEADR